MYTDPPHRPISDADLKKLLAVARGDQPADVLLSGGRVINVFTGEIEQTDIAICGSRIAGLGKDYVGHQRIDLHNAYIAPGLIDAHVHIESSLCIPAQFAAAIIPRGVTSVVTDPHELANVAGPAGVEFIARGSRNLPLDVTIMAPSCVPATPMANTGGTVTAQNLHSLRSAKTAHGLAEVMNFPGVIAGDPAMLEKLFAMSGRPIDGHCPGVTDRALNAYVAAGIGSDHESITAAEAREKISRGLYLLIREATNARNLDTLLPVITSANARRICFCTDDRTPGDLLRVGSVDHMIRRAIEFGIDPIEAIRMATLNPAEWFGLSLVGAIAPGRLANLIVFDDLQKPQAKMVFARGELIARDGDLLPHVKLNLATDGPSLPGRCQINWSQFNLAVPAKSDRIRVIGALPDQLVTEHRVMPAKRDEAGNAVADPARDLLKMAVVERHGGAGGMGVGFIQGFGLHRGAIAGTVAHDHHNLICIGADDDSMLTAIKAVAEMGGGLAVVVDGAIVAQLPLPVGGLMSDRPVREVAAAYDALVAGARELGSTLSDPFMAMSFMALEVIPSLKLTDRGLVDVEHFAFVDLFA